MDNQARADITAILGTAPGRRRGGRWLLAAVVAVALAAAIIAALSGNGGPTVHYAMEPARRGPLTVAVTATGNLAPTNQVDVGSELSGIVAEVAVDYNDQVTVDQVLARLDTSKLNALLQQVEATLASAEARVLQARATAREAAAQLARLRRAGASVSSEQQLDAAEAAQLRADAEVAVAQAAVAQARATLTSHRTDLAKSVIRSPVDGIVLSRTVEPGQTVAASFQAPVLFTLAEDLAQMELHVDVDEADVGLVEAGQAATFTVDAYPARTFPAHIRQVRYGAKTVDGVVTYETVLEVDNSDLSLRPGMTATADIVVRHIKDALLVPSAALRFAPVERESPRGPVGPFATLFRRNPSPTRAARPDVAPPGPRVWVLRAGTPTAVPVAVGANDGRFTEILGGDIEPGAELIVDATSPPP